MSKIHELKTWPPYFGELQIGRKTFEARKDDRGFEKGDVLILREYDPSTQTYSGKELAFIAGYILRGGEFGVAEGYCIISLIPSQQATEAYT